MLFAKLERKSFTFTMSMVGLKNAFCGRKSKLWKFKNVPRSNLEIHVASKFGPVPCVIPSQGLLGWLYWNKKNGTSPMKILSGNSADSKNEQSSHIPITNIAKLNLNTNLPDFLQWEAKQLLMLCKLLLSIGLLLAFSIKHPYITLYLWGGGFGSSITCRGVWITK